MTVDCGNFGVVAEGGLEGWGRTVGAGRWGCLSPLAAPKFPEWLSINCFGK